jgi:hypothetical protein
MAGDVQRLLLRAGVPVGRSQSTGVLTTEPILVFLGEPREDYGIYDQHDRLVGVAAKVKDRYSKVGYGYHYEISDTQPRCELRDVTRRRFGVDSLWHAFSVVDPTGSEIGRIALTGRRNDSYEITVGGRPVGRLRYFPQRQTVIEPQPFAAPPTLIEKGKRLIDRATSRVWSIEDESGLSIARVTYLSMNKLNPLRDREVAYVFTPEPRLQGPLRTLALSVCVVVDNRIIDDRPQRGGAA